MAEVIRMPKMSDTMEEGVIASWLKKEGDTVKAGDILAEIETDKATMELEAYEDGTLLHVGVKEKTAIPINALIAIIGEPGEDITALLAASPSTPPTQQEDTATTTPLEASNDGTTHATPTAGTTPLADQPHLFASPIAKKMAQEKGYELANIQGTGEGGRIIKRDIEGAAATTQPKETLPRITLPPVVGEEAYEDVPISNMRKIIAKRLVESKLSAPHFYLTIDVAMDEVVVARASINAYAPIKVSLNDIIIKAAAQAIRQHPAINVAWLQEKIRYNKHIHMGVAVAVAEGLVVPVLHFVDNKPLVHIAAEVKTLSQKAHSKQLRPQDLQGSTFTISNLGMLGIESFTAIVNPPEACILAIGAIKQVPIVRDGTVLVGYAMKATLSCDHRVVDGAVGATFLKTFKELLEDPRRMLAH
jgi:pyruvate dehydrogenase E2 component (dihydrolipoamide acetyltransferase)